MRSTPSTPRPSTRCSCSVDVEGDLDALGADGIAVSAEHATEQGWTIGTKVPVTFPSGDTSLVVEAIYSGGTDWVGSMFVDLDALAANGGDALDYRVYVSGDEAAISHVAAAYGSANVLDKDGFLDSRRVPRSTRCSACSTPC